MIARDFGSTGLRVSALGFGAGHIGSPDLGKDDAGRLLHHALDLGITLIDTARGYGLSEERIGRHLKARRGEFVLSSKGGYGVDGVPDWTPENIRLGIERALRTLQTDVIDIFHLHSCPLETLRQEELLGALDAARQRGEIRVAAYSGENDALAWAAQSPHFGSLQTSVNVVDQWSLRQVLPDAAVRGLGIIAKRPVANAAWRFAERPTGQYEQAYWDRLQQGGLTPGDLDWDEFALRFSTFAPGVQSVIVGTAKLERLTHNAAIVARGPLPESEIQRVMTAFGPYVSQWQGEV
ncbi:aldo/keto reductase [Deinococcus sp. QL22]|uniref:aldo/keto reductase n=1 Tax=Deinococcus sp. QL22 TaxID=2939437 RepID=UPI002016E8BA|nr:aldo/keto reductase [Deinococcus sp. QL22]UQN09678.1 aldo/keto reductase [Deinococcus sp. QL22]